MAEQTSGPLLSIKDISKVYHAGKPNEVRALDGVSIDIKPGEVLGLLGVNGAGKTTLSSLIATLHPPTGGDILFKGNSIYSDLYAYRRALGLCPQYPNLDPYLNVRDNLVFAGRYYGMSTGDSEERADYLLELYNLEKYKAFDIHALSGGTRQRVLIARALMHSPELVILDEPTVGLDPDIRHSLWEHIKSLKKSGVTVLLTTHYLDEAEYLADRICLLRGGKVQLIRTVDELKSEHAGQSLESIFLTLTREQYAQEE